MLTKKRGKFARNLAVMNEPCSIPTKITQRQINIPIVAAVSPGGGPHNPNVSVPFRALFQITACQIVSSRHLNHSRPALSHTGASVGSRAASQGLVSLLIQEGTSMRALQQCKQSCVPCLVDTNGLRALSKD